MSFRSLTLDTHRKLDNHNGSGWSRDPKSGSIITRVRESGEQKVISPRYESHINYLESEADF